MPHSRDRHHTVESNGLSNFLLEKSSKLGDSIRKISSAHTRSQADYDMVDKYEILVEVVQCRNAEYGQILLASSKVNLEQLSKQGKNVLVHAVERKDAAPCMSFWTRRQAYANIINERGLVALHLETRAGLYGMDGFLLNQNTDIELRDKGETPMVGVIRAGDLRMVEMLFNQEECILQTTGGDG